MPPRSHNWSTNIIKQLSYRVALLPHDFCSICSTSLTLENMVNIGDSLSPPYPLFGVHVCMFLPVGVILCNLACTLPAAAVVCFLHFVNFSFPLFRFPLPVELTTSMNKSMVLSFLWLASWFLFILQALITIFHVKLCLISKKPITEPLN